MVQLDTYDIAPPEESIRTEEVPKPKPETEPLEILEMDRVLPPFDRGVLFSGGDDSLVLTHLAMENEWVDVVIHLQTNSAIPDNTDYVRRVCREMAWPLIIIRSPMPLETFGCRYGFPGAVCPRHHDWNDGSRQRVGIRRSRPVRNVSHLWSPRR